MPAAYAHYVFGQKVLKELPEDLKKRIKDYLPLFHVGVHGPDILFYYHPYKSNPISRMGHSMHEAVAYDFFDNARAVLNEADPAMRPAMEAYLAGFVCHYMLDSECHGYINALVEKGEISHSEIECEFDGMLMRKKGLDPQKRNAAKHVLVNEASAEVIAPFFNLEPKIIKESVKSLNWYQKFLLCPGKAKRILLTKAMHLAGSHEIVGMIPNETPNEKCFESNVWLFDRLKKAVEPCADLLEEYFGQLDKGVELNERFCRNFE